MQVAQHAGTQSRAGRAGRRAYLPGGTRRARGTTPGGPAAAAEAGAGAAAVVAAAEAPTCRPSAQAGGAVSSCAAQL